MPRHHLHVIYDEGGQDAPSRKTGTNQPELRQATILKMLREHFGSKTAEGGKGFTQQGNSTEASNTFLTRIHSPSFVAFLQRAYEDAAAAEDKDWFSKGALLPYTLYTNGDGDRDGDGDGAGGKEEKKRERLVALLRPYKQSGVYARDLMSPIMAHTWRQSARSAHNSLLAAEYLQKHPDHLVYLCNSSPGHHASRARYAGYCFLNNVALLAQALLDQGGGRVAIIDVDYHAGDGTQALFYKRHDVVTLSIHSDPVIEYPCYSGFADETGEANGMGCNYNIPLKARATWSNDYAPALAESVRKMMKVHTGIRHVIIAFGADTYMNDPDPSNIAGMKLDINDYYEMGKLLKTEVGPAVTLSVTQEGGYCIQAVGSIVLRFMEGLLSA